MFDKNIYFLSFIFDKNALFSSIIFDNMPQLAPQLAESIQHMCDYLLSSCQWYNHLSIVIIAVFPFELHRRGHKVFAYLVVNVCLMGLTQLIAPWHIKHLSILDEMGTRLMKAKGDIFGDTLLAKGKYPIVVAWSCLNSRLTAYRHFLYRVIKIRGNIHGCNQRGCNAIS